MVTKQFSWSIYSCSQTGDAYLTNAVPVVNLTLSKKKLCFKPIHFHVEFYFKFSTLDLVLYLNEANFLVPFLAWIKKTFWNWYFQLYIEGLFSPTIIILLKYPGDQCDWILMSDFWHTRSRDFQTAAYSRRGIKSKEEGETTWNLDFHLLLKIGDVSQWVLNS